MAVSFENIPPNLRVPLAFFEFSSEAAGRSTRIQNALLLCTVQTGAPLALGVPTLVRSADHARQLAGAQMGDPADPGTAAIRAAGAGSALGRQAERWFQNNRAGVPLYALAAGQATFTASSGTITMGGPAEEAGTISLYIGGRRVPVIVAVGDDQDDLAVAVAAAINADRRIGVSAAVDATDTEQVNVTALQLGLLGRLRLQHSLEGPEGGEILPNGVTITFGQMSAGAGSPVVAGLLDTVGDAPYDFVLCPWVGGADLNALDEFLNDVSGRWSWQSMLYGHAWTATDRTLANLQSLGELRNGQHVSIFGLFNSPTPEDEIMAAYSAQCAGSLVIDPARPVQGLQLRGVRLPPIQDRFTVVEKNTLFFNGISTYQADDGVTMAISRVITTYRVNRWGAPDDSMLDVETMFTAMAFARFMRDRILLKFPRSKLADDGTRFGAGQAIVTPAIIRAEMIAAYAELEESGLVENADGFEEALIVERNAQDRNRIDLLLPPDFVNQMRIFAALVQWIG